MGGSSGGGNQVSRGNQRTSGWNSNNTDQAQRGRSFTKTTAPKWARQSWKGALKDYENNPYWQDAWSGAMDVANGAGGYLDTALGAFNDMASGKYLYGGEGFDAAVDAAFRKGMPGVLSRFGMSGRSDGGLAKTALAQAFADPFAMQYGQNLQMMMDAAKGLPGMALLPSSIKEGVASAFDQRQLGQLNFLQPWLGKRSFTSGNQSIDSFAKNFSRGRNWSSTSMPEYSSNPFAAGIGGAMSGAQLGGAVLPGMGAPIGALAGGLLGAIG